MGSAARRGLAFWAGHVEAWRRSGLSRGATCARHGLTPKTFSWWVWRIGQGDAAVCREDRQAVLVPVAVRALPPPPVPAPPPSAEAARIEVELPGGVKVRVGAGFDGATLRRVLEAVGS